MFNLNGLKYIFKYWANVKVTVGTRQRGCMYLLLAQVLCG